MYETWKSVLSLADFGVLAGYAAIKHGVEEDRTGCNFGQCTISLEFTAGRRTCANPDRPPTVQFPHGDDTDTPVTFVMQPFSLTPEQTVALIGTFHRSRNFWRNCKTSPLHANLSRISSKPLLSEGDGEKYVFCSAFAKYCTFWVIQMTWHDMTTSFNMNTLRTSLKIIYGLFARIRQIMVTKIATTISHFCYISKSHILATCYTYSKDVKS